MTLGRAIMAAVLPWAIAGLTDQELRQPALMQEIVDHINGDPTSTWVAEMSPRFANKTLADVVALCGVRDDPTLQPVSLRQYDRTNSVPTPSSFDWRQQMGAKCPGILRVKDQANCGSCWVFGAVEVMEDRACIQSGGSVQLDLSEQDVTSCKGGSGSLGGCSGGQPMTAWNYFHEDGIVTGGAFGETSGCFPYALHPCNHHTHNSEYPDCPADTGTPVCDKTCVNGQRWDDAKVRNLHAPYALSGVSAISQDLLQKGPVTVVFKVYQDFPAYKSGIYSPMWPPVELGGHAVAIYGYGGDGLNSYWLVKNSWNPTWGENGFFRISKTCCEITTGWGGLTPCAADVSLDMSSFSLLSLV